VGYGRGEGRKRKEKPSSGAEKGIGIGIREVGKREEEIRWGKGGRGPFRPCCTSASFRRRAGKKKEETGGKKFEAVKKCANVLSRQGGYGGGFKKGG